MADEKRKPIDAVPVVEVSSSMMKASIFICPPQNGGADLILPQLEKILKEKGITTGILLDRLESIAKKPIYSKLIVVAKGVEGIKGDDAEIMFHFQVDDEPIIKENHDRRFKYRDLSLTGQVKKGTLLCEKRKAAAGKPGMDVFGRGIEAKVGSDKDIPVGKNTVLSEDKQKLFADIDGQVQLIGGKIHVFDTYVVEDSVTEYTGNILYSGNIVVKGAVTRGFSVEADGNIDIHGYSESANIVAGGCLIVRNGIIESIKNKIEVGGSLACKYIHKARVIVGGDLETGYIKDSNIICGGAVSMRGEGDITGGFIFASGSVFAKTIGYGMPKTFTSIEVGASASLSNREMILDKEFALCKENEKQCELILKSMLPMKNAGTLLPDKLQIIEKVIQQLDRISSTIDEIKAEKEYIREQRLELCKNTVNVSKVVYYGVKIAIWDKWIQLDREYGATSFRYTDDGIACCPM